MSEALIGVIIGGLLSGAGTWLGLLTQQSKWRTELRIAHLKDKRERLEAACQRILDALPNAIAQNSYPIQIMSEIDFLLPESVSDAFADMMKDKDKTTNEFKAKSHYYTIARCMRKEVRLIDEEIERVAIGKKPSNPSKPST